MERIPFTQRFVGAVLVTVVGGLIVHTATEKPHFGWLRSLFAPSGEAAGSVTDRPVDPSGDPSEPADPVVDEDAELSPDERALRQTVADIRTVGVSMFAWLVDQASAPDGADQAPGGDSGGSKELAGLERHAPISYRDLYRLLVPAYMDKVPRTDGWGHPFDFYLDVQSPLSRNAVAIRSRGRDGQASGPEYRVGPFPPDDFDEDIVWTDGFFVQWPNLPD